MRAWDLVMSHTVYACVVGSRAYGLAGDGSDTDRRGVFQAPTAMFWHLEKPPTHVDGPLAEQFSWELERCCTLALQANPTVLECLWSPLVEAVTPVGAELVAVRKAFLSRKVAHTYGDYAADQLQKLEAVLTRHGEIRWKQAMHMVRLLMAGAFVLRTGEVLVDVSDSRELLLSIKHGERSWDEVLALTGRLRSSLAAAAAATSLPAEPDRDTVDDFLASARRAAL